MAKGNGLIPEEIVKLLNYRINQEELSARLYYAMSEWLENKGYFGAAGMIKRWSDEETIHANWAVDFLEAYDYLPEIGALEDVPTEYKSLKDCISKSYDHEVEITDQCNELASRVVKASCFCAMPLALKYMHEQTDELEKTNKWLTRVSMVADDPRELMLIDREMGGGDCGGCEPTMKSSY